MTNGLILNIPLKPNNKKTSLEEFDNLNLEFWRHNVIKNGVYTPKKYISNWIINFFKYNSFLEFLKKLINCFKF